MQRHRIPPGVGTQQSSLTGVLSQQTEQNPDGGRRAGPVRTEEAVHLAGFDREVEFIERPGVAEGLDQAGHVDRGHQRSSPKHRKEVWKNSTRLHLLATAASPAPAGRGAESSRRTG